MSKDVDLSSKEWCDIVFENKNKEFGAYEMRQKSDGRHNKSMIVVVIFIIIVFILAQVVQTIQQKWEEAQPKDTIEQVVTSVDNATEEEEEEEAVDGLRDGVPVEWRCDDDAQDGFF